MMWNQAEYDAVRTCAGLLDLSERGRIEVRGKNRVQFLHGLVSNDIKILRDGDGTYAAFLNATGRIHSDCFIYADGERFLIDTPANTRAWVYQSLAKFTPAGGFDVTDITEQTALLSLQGARAAEILAVLGVADELQPLKLKHIKIAGIDVLIAKVSRTAETGYDLVVSLDGKKALHGALIEVGAVEVGAQTAEVLRIEAGIPAYGRDMDETIILLEAGLESAVSYKKGCYLGQETIAKIHHRGHDQTAKRLMGLLIEGESVPPPGSKVFNGAGKEIGHITSSCYSPVLAKPIALAYLRRNNFEPGMRHTVVSGDLKLEAEVAKLPFLKGGEYERAAR